MWTADIEPKVFTKLKTILENKFKDKYKNLNFTTINSNNDETSFPCVYLHTIGMEERGQDIYGVDVVGAFVTFQVSISSNKSKSEVTEIANEAVKVMKSMKFTIMSFPIVTKSNEVFTSVFRARRIIGGQDIL